MIIKLKEIRKKRDLTLKQLSKISKISISHLSYIENGDRIPTIDIICKLSKALKCQPEELYECENSDGT